MSTTKAKTATSVNDLAEIYDIQQLKYRYLRAVDTHDWDLMKECFAEDANVWYDSGIYKHEGRETILNFFRTYLDQYLFSSHIAVHPEIAITSPTTATGSWRIQDIVFNVEPDLSKVLPAKIKTGQWLEGAGYYYDEYAKLADRWVIKTSGYVRIFEYVSNPRYPHTENPAFTGDHFLRTVASRGARK